MSSVGMYTQGKRDGHTACAQAAAEGSHGGVPERTGAQCAASLVQRACAVEELFPPGVAAFELGGGAVSLTDLFASERECIARSVEKRAQEFAAGRLCARAGLAALGLKPTALLPGLDRTPVWPSGMVGSITHTDGYCVAVVAPHMQFAAVGVDAERIADVSPSLWPLTMRSEELRRLQGMEDPERQRMAAMIFSAKEAFYKCQFALTRRWLGFEDVVVDAVADAFEVSVVQPTHLIQHQLAPWVGRFKIDATFVIAGIAVRNRDDRR